MSLADNTRKFSVTCARVSNRRSYPGGLVSFLVTSAATHVGANGNDPRSPSRPRTGLPFKSARDEVSG
jgi:hypothetical protein